MNPRAEEAFASFREWTLAALQAFGASMPRHWTNYVDSPSSLAPPEALLVQEMQSFARYVGRRWAGAAAIQPRPTDSVEQEESCSIASTVLDSLMKLFPKLASLWNACKEAVDIRKAIIRGNRT